MVVLCEQVKVSFKTQEILLLTKSNLSTFSFITCALGVLSRKPWLLQGHDDVWFSSNNCADLALGVMSVMHLAFNFCIFHEVGIYLHSFSCGYPVVLALFTQKAVLSLLNCFGTFLSNIS